MGLRGVSCSDSVTSPVEPLGYRGRRKGPSVRSVTVGEKIGQESSGLPLSGDESRRRRSRKWSRKGLGET